MSIRLVRGAEADSLLANEPFCVDWAALRERCTWATAFQTPDFVTAWYRVYRKRFEPLLVLGRDDAGKLTAVLPLAICSQSGVLTPAGAHQAEYQGWICLPEIAQSFPAEAFDRLRRQFPSAEVRFRYLPAGIPLEWTGTEDGPPSVLKSFRRPLMQLGDGSAVRQSLQKSGNRSRLRQMKRRGAVEFKRVTDPAEFEALLDQIAVCHDCRQLAIHGTAPFLEDDLKRAFHLAMLNAPGLLHVTVLKVGDEVASFHLNVTRGRELQLYLIAHDPRFATYSPGKLHVLFLARMVQADGFQRIDLTPGGDEYKERFANDGDEVHRLSVHPSAAHRVQGMVLNKVEDAARDLLGRVDLTPANIRCALSECGIRRVAALAADLPGRWRRWLGAMREIRVYACDATRDWSASEGIHRDDLNHLLAYQPMACEPSRRKFLSQAMRRFEDGQHLYTRMNAGRMYAFGWLLDEPSEQWGTEVLPGFEVPTGSAMILDCRLPTDRAGRLASTMALRTMVHDASIAGARRVYVAIPTQRGTDDGLLQEIGFTYQGSLLRRSRAGRSAIRAKVAGRTTPADEAPFDPNLVIPVHFESSKVLREEPRRKTG